MSYNGFMVSQQTSDKRLFYISQSLDKLESVFCEDEEHPEQKVVDEASV